jgi:DNA-binding response OmpR family regulator
MRKILIIEDDNNLVDLYQAKFTIEKFDVLTASDGAQGIETAVREQPDVILLDVLMPNVNGFEVLKNLKDHPETKDIPVVVYTNLGSNDSDEKRELAFSLGAADYLIKALHEPESIVTRINELMAARDKTPQDQAA